MEKWRFCLIYLVYFVNKIFMEETLICSEKNYLNWEFIKKSNYWKPHHVNVSSDKFFKNSAGKIIFLKKILSKKVFWIIW